ncbi:MAG: radical SAM protein [Dehalococcoidales bacterium]|nr:radical SAM protein [Dehalococcoidales bacterium]
MKKWNGTIDNAGYVSPLNKSLKVFFRNALRVSLSHPAQAAYFLRTVQRQKKAAQVRASYREQGLQVPPIMIYSITNRCNLHCKGCYHQTLRAGAHEEMSTVKMRSVIAEAKGLGISFLVLAGGEPLVRPEILDITGANPDIIFFVFTNGLLINDAVAERLKKQRNVVPIISLEGYAKDTDERRGAGIYERLQIVAKKLKSKGIFFGTSLTMTSLNYDTLTGERFIRSLTRAGCKLFFFVEYSPVQPGTEALAISNWQRDCLPCAVNKLRKKFPALFIAVPGDEKEFGGCLSAGRGFIHVSAAGNVEPCPFVPYSDANLTQVSFKEALRSDFLRKVREGVREHEGKGGCTLWEKRDWVQSLLARNHDEDWTLPAVPEKEPAVR